ncbi:MAG: hypothetical protein KGR98_05580, partial [Verrucomicrobia bacterium]|nr:hypothetical protein [Verrucomicrobiota bacterium]
QLVYHDAVLVSFAQGKGGTKDLMRGILYGGVPQVPVNMKGIGAKAYELNREMAALNGRVGLLAMTNHEFLNKQRSRERTTFADGTTVTVDWMAMTVRIKPPLTSAELDATGMRKAR